MLAISRGRPVPMLLRLWTTRGACGGSSRLGMRLLEPHSTQRRHFLKGSRPRLRQVIYRLESSNPTVGRRYLRAGGPVFTGLGRGVHYITVSSRRGRGGREILEPSWARFTNYRPR